MSGRRGGPRWWQWRERRRQQRKATEVLTEFRELMKQPRYTNRQDVKSQEWKP